ncbi:MAG: hypothetical protein HY364_01700 [Candidatus Aenigmarchaeota archaeon]|nr:hypothetical protein [Candidatus Aenigmarchaeota archaeon]
MKDASFFSLDSLAKEGLPIIKERLRVEIKTMERALSVNSADGREFARLPFDNDMLGAVKNMIKEKRALKPEYVVVIGIGGSSLGTEAVGQAVVLKGKRPKLLYANTADSFTLQSIMEKIEEVLAKKKTIILNCVSKSGSTAETAANFQILLAILKRYRKDYAKFVVITTDKDSRLWHAALTQGFSVLEIPSRIGGRYSVFSAVGLFPLGMAGVNLDGLLSGAAAMAKRCVERDVEMNPAAMSAAILYWHLQRGRKIHDTFLFSPAFECLGKWYRQLMAESVGKALDKNGKKVSAGMTPTVSLPQDLHSMAQLYLGGPQDKFTTFVKSEDNGAAIKVPSMKEYSGLSENIQGRSLSEITDALYGGIVAAYRDGKRPFAEIHIPDRSSQSIGQFLQMKMMEMCYLCYLMNVNPFDQPAVESYKFNARQMLGEKKGQ